MQKGIILFDIKDFLYQGMNRENPDIEEINRKQMEVLGCLHNMMMKERERRTREGTNLPTVDIFLPTGDGYYFLGSPELDCVLDIAACIMGMLSTLKVNAYCVAHIGELSIFDDMTGRTNATGFDLVYASRLLDISKNTETLIVSEAIASEWGPNHFFDLEEGLSTNTAKDGVDYYWRTARLTKMAAY